jgi:hypothetical protein
MASRSPAIEREGNPHPLAIVAANLEAIGAPAPIALIDRNAAVMPPLDAAKIGRPRIETTCEPGAPYVFDAARLARVWICLVFAPNTDRASPPLRQQRRPTTQPGCFHRTVAVELSSQMI